MNAVFRLHKSEENNYHSSRGHNKIIHVAVQVLVASVLLVIALCCSAHAVNIDATVPASLPITVSSDGTVTTATNAAIRNYSSSPIIVSSINVTAQNGWSLVTKDEAAAAAVGDKVISMGINGSWMDVSGVVNTSGFSSIAASHSLPIPYEARIPESLSTEPASTAATVTFFIRMPVPVMAAGSSWYKSSKDRRTITKITFTDSYTPSIEADETWFADVDNTGSITCYRNGKELIIAGNGSGKIQANADSSWMFSSNDSECFRNLESIDNLSLLDTTSVTNMSNMFLWCSSLSNFDLSAFNTSNVENMQGMFNFCEITTLDLSNFDTSSVVNMSSMFATLMQLPPTDLGNSDTQYYCGLDLTSFDTSNVTNMSNMFYGRASLSTIYVSDKWDISNVVDSGGMFAGCYRLKGDIAWGSGVDKTYATIKGGYLTYKAASMRTLSLNIDPNTGTVTSYDVSSSPIKQFRIA